MSISGSDMTNYGRSARRASVRAVDESGGEVGTIRVTLDEHGDVPRCVADEWGTTWLLGTDGRALRYVRTARVSAMLEIKR